MAFIILYVHIISRTTTGKWSQKKQEAMKEVGRRKKRATIGFRVASKRGDNTQKLRKERCEIDPAGGPAGMEIQARDRETLAQILEEAWPGAAISIVNEDPCVSTDVNNDIQMEPAVSTHDLQMELEQNTHDSDADSERSGIGHRLAVPRLQEEDTQEGTTGTVERPRTPPCLGCLRPCTARVSSSCRRRCGKPRGWSHGLHMCAPCEWEYHASFPAWMRPRDI